MNEEILDNIIKLNNKFIEVKKLGYVNGINIKSKGNAGITFEYLIGKNNDNFQIADFEGIEIKVRSFLKTSKIRLFSLVPSNSFGLEIKRLRKMYGISNSTFPDVKTIHCYAVTTKKISLQNNFKVKLEIDYDEERIYLLVYEQNNLLLEKKLYWDFDDIIIALKRKLNTLAIVSFNKRIKDNITQFHFYDINFYKLKSEIVFFKLIEQGIIYMQFNLGVYKSGFKIGKEHDNGICFCININSLFKLYKKINI